MNPEGARVLLIEARFYQDVAAALGDGAARVLEAAGAMVDRVQVPGVFEIPAAMSLALDGGGKPDGIVTLGCVIRGETDHYAHICRAAIGAIMELTLAHGIAHGFGVLTCDTHDQAWQRADIEGRDIGGRAAEACLRMMAVKAELSGQRR